MTLYAASKNVAAVVACMERKTREREFYDRFQRPSKADYFRTRTKAEQKSLVVQVAPERVDIVKDHFYDHAKLPEMIAACLKGDAFELQRLFFEGIGESLEDTINDEFSEFTHDND